MDAVISVDDLLLEVVDAATSVNNLLLKLADAAISIDDLLPELVDAAVSVDNLLLKLMDLVVSVDNLLAEQFVLLPSRFAGRPRATLGPLVCSAPSAIATGCVSWAAWRGLRAARPWVAT